MPALFFSGGSEITRKSGYLETESWRPYEDTETVISSSEVTDFEAVLSHMWMSIAYLGLK